MSWVCEATRDGNKPDELAPHATSDNSYAKEYT